MVSGYFVILPRKTRMTWRNERMWKYAKVWKYDVTGLMLVDISGILTTPTCCIKEEPILVSISRNYLSTTAN